VSGNTGVARSEAGRCGSGLRAGLVVALLGSLLATACGGGSAAHDQDVQGVMHASGKEDPLRSCTRCHGSDLRGGDGPSCYGCHSSADHDVSRGGVMHRSGVMTDCTPCHGPDNSGGLGPACTTCH
jgi:hypothetical protein